MTTFNRNRSPKPRKCRSCGKSYQPISSWQRACAPACAIKIARDARARRDKAAVLKDRKEHRQARAKLMTRRQWVQKAQTAFNTWVRLRDAAQACVSCATRDTPQWHAGHYLSVGARPELRFEPDNCWKQCAQCNLHQHGNLILYRAELIRRIGMGRVEWLEGPHAPKRYTVADLMSMTAIYLERVRELRKRAA